MERRDPRALEAGSFQILGQACPRRAIVINDEQPFQLGLSHAYSRAGTFPQGGPFYVRMYASVAETSLTQPDRMTQPYRSALARASAS